MPNVEDLRSHLLSQDVIWVGGGSVANLLALWRVHGLDEIMREAWEAGVVLAGVSAGSLCWHVGGTTARSARICGPSRMASDFSHTATASTTTPKPSAGRSSNSSSASGTLPLSFATDDGVGLHYVGTELVEAVAELPDRSAWRVEADGGGQVTEVEIIPRLLDPQ